MAIALFLLTLAALGYLIWNLIRAFSKARRPQALKRAKWTGVVSAVAMVLFVVAAVREQDAAAIALGFDNSEDQRAAELANIADAAPWKDYKASEAARVASASAAQAAAAEEEARREKAEEDARNAEELRRAEEAAAVEEEKRLAAKAAEEAACRKNLECWGEEASITAAVSCPRIIERMAKYTSEWTDGWLDGKFTHYRWKNAEEGVVTVLGDKIRFQNGFGAWQNIIYECDLDPASKEVVDVRVRNGKL